MSFLGLISFAGVLSKDSSLLINLFKAICFEEPLTKKANSLDADNIFGVNEILFNPFPSLNITKSLLLFIFLYGKSDAVCPSSPRPRSVRSKEGGFP